MDAALWPYGKCEKCTNKNYCVWSNAEIENCMNNDYQNFSPTTNADRIRAMTDEELADMFGEHSKRRDCCPNYGSYDCRATCEECWLNWLKSPVEPGEGDK